MARGSETHQVQLDDLTKALSLAPEQKPKFADMRSKMEARREEHQSAQQALPLPPPCI